VLVGNRWRFFVDSRTWGQVPFVYLVKMEGTKKPGLCESRLGSELRVRIFIFSAGSPAGFFFRRDPKSPPFALCFSP